MTMIEKNLFGVQFVILQNTNILFYVEKLDKILKSRRRRWKHMVKKLSSETIDMR